MPGSFSNTECTVASVAWKRWWWLDSLPLVQQLLYYTCTVCPNLVGTWFRGYLQIQAIRKNLDCEIRIKYLKLLMHEECFCEMFWNTCSNPQKLRACENLDAYGIQLKLLVQFLWSKIACYLWLKFHTWMTLHKKVFVVSNYVYLPNVTSDQKNLHAQSLLHVHKPDYGRTV